MALRGWVSMGWPFTSATAEGHAACTRQAEGGAQPPPHAAEARSKDSKHVSSRNPSPTPTRLAALLRVLACWRKLIQLKNNQHTQRRMLHEAHPSCSPPARPCARRGRRSRSRWPSGSSGSCAPLHSGWVQLGNQFKRIWGGGRSRSRGLVQLPVRGRMSLGMFGRCDRLNKKYKQTVC